MLNLKEKLAELVGILQVEDLSLVNEDVIIDALAANSSAMCKTRLRAIKRWVQDRSDDQAPLDIIFFTPSVCRTCQMELARTGRSSKNADKTSNTDKVKLPSFNGKAEQWNKSKRELTAYLNQMRNTRNVPI